MSFEKTRDHLEKFIQKEYVDNPDMASPDIERGMRDLLTDMIHLCDKHEIDFEDLKSRAHEVYEEEIMTELQEKTGQID
jgi:hypothetical protein